MLRPLEPPYLVHKSIRFQVLDIVRKAIFSECCDTNHIYHSPSCSSHQRGLLFLGFEKESDRRNIALGRKGKGCNLPNLSHTYKFTENASILSYVSSIKSSAMFFSALIGVLGNVRELSSGIYSFNLRLASVLFSWVIKLNGCLGNR
jgi:hypothetical protein